LRVFKTQIFLNAATFVAAFFLCIPCKAVFKAKLVKGKIESISDTLNNTVSIHPVKDDDLLEYNQLICAAKDSRGEFQLNSYTIRLGSLSVLSVLSENSFFLHSGSMLIAYKNESEFKISTSSSTATFTGSGTILIETTNNGGFKFIPFEGRGTLKTENKNSQEIKGGRLVLVLGKPSKLGDAYDLDLMLLLKTCRLINSFPEPLDTFGRISLAVYSQELKLKGKYNALIGDAPNDTNLQVWAFGEDSDQETDNKK